MRIKFCQKVIDIVRGKIKLKLIQQIQEFNKPVILTRVACLGTFSFENIDLSSYKLINHQKNRVDYMLNINNNAKFKININEVLKFIPNSFKWGIYMMYQQKKDIFKYKNVKALIMDSFSELTDQLFVSKKSNSCFCTHYNNVVHNEEFEQLYNCEGLLQVEQLSSLYNEFFSKIKKTYGNIPIIFINFPAKLDSRELFKSREKAIAASISGGGKCYQFRYC